MNNLCNKSELSEVQDRLDKLLYEKLDKMNDRFLPAEHYINEWSYTVDETGTVPYTN